MSDPKSPDPRLDDSLFLGPPPSLGGTTAGPVGPGEESPGVTSAPADRTPSGRPPWWSAAAETARLAGPLPGARLAPSPSVPRDPPEPAPGTVPAVPSAADAPWWSPSRERRAPPPERPRAYRPSPIRPVRVPGVPLPAPVARPARAPWWSAAAKAERAKPSLAPVPPGDATASAHWWARPPRRASSPQGRRVRVFPPPSASAPDGRPWWSAAAWETRPDPAEEARAAPPASGDGGRP